MFCFFVIFYFFFIPSASSLSARLRTAPARDRDRAATPAPTVAHYACDKRANAIFVFNRFAGERGRRRFKNSKVLTA